MSQLWQRVPARAPLFAGRFMQHVRLALQPPLSLAVAQFHVMSDQGGDKPAPLPCYDWLAAQGFSVQGRGAGLSPPWSLLYGFLVGRVAGVVCGVMIMVGVGVTLGTLWIVTTGLFC